MAMMQSGRRGFTGLVASLLVVLAAFSCIWPSAFSTIAPTPPSATALRNGVLPVRAASATLVASAPEIPQSSSSTSTSTFAFVCCVAVAAAASRLSAATSRGEDSVGLTTMFGNFKKYKTGPFRRDPTVEFGPQYHGKKLDYAIRCGPQHGQPKRGYMRVIPKLSGGKWITRKNTMKTLTTCVIQHGRIKTTRARADSLTHFVDRMILLAIRGDDLSRREANEWMTEDKIVENLFKLAKDRYPDQYKGFCKVTDTMPRKGDGAKMAYIELI
eukprot:TRINITY_DN64506_c0_g1_i1.p1 TRINITY_DN64506_c0_g1~~TRINITY_DN64506_c0_g1_i1.p1  ORF type:complete len:271 (+),score=40.35 TRINITY_DN64506_c0_g1_i1:51-863(+)